MGRVVNLDIERRAVGAALKLPALLADSGLCAQDFADPVLRDAWTMVGSPLNIVAHRLRDRGGAALVAQLVDLCHVEEGVPGGFRYQCQEIKRLASERLGVDPGEVLSQVYEDRLMLDLRDVPF